MCFLMNKEQKQWMEYIYSEIAEIAYMMLHMSKTAFHDVMLPKSQLINREIVGKQATFIVWWYLAKKRGNIEVNSFFVEWHTQV